MVRDGSGHEMCLNLKKDKKVRWKKNFTLVIPEIKEEDLPSYYRLEGGRGLDKINDEVLEDELKNLDWTTELDESKTNADIQQSHQPQKLKAEEISEMKTAGKDSNQIISDLIKNNENFEKRTDFSKEKYIKKKKMKYDLVWKIQKCTLNEVFKHLQKMSPKDMM